MINPESRTREWIESLRTQYPYIKDASLLEKTIRAFSLLESLVRDAAKVAYLARLLHLSIDEVRHYTPADDAALATEVIEDQTLNKLNRLKKVNTEAFFYCRRLEELR